MSNRIKRFIRKLEGRENGYTLIEVLVALAILGVIGTGIYISLGTSLIGTVKIDERTTAKNLAEAQMEYVKQLKLYYSDYYDDETYEYFTYFIENPPLEYAPDEEIMSQYSGYEVTITAAMVNQGVRDELLELWDLMEPGDYRYRFVQLITIRVFHDEEQVLLMEGIKLISDDTYADL